MLILFVSLQIANKFLRCGNPQIRKFVMINPQIAKTLISLVSQFTNPQICKEKISSTLACRFYIFYLSRICKYILDYQMPKFALNLNESNLRLYIFVRRKIMYLRICGSFKSANRNSANRKEIYGPQIATLAEGPQT